jgi:transmembrane sensor
MFPAKPSADNDDHDDPAAFWFARMNSGDTPGLEDEARFRQWLNADPDHIEAYRQCQVAWREMGTVAAVPDILAQRATALQPSHQISRRRTLLGLTGGAVAAAGAGLWVMTASSPARALIVTAPGQRLTAALPDGSEVTLAPLTRLRLDYRTDRRGGTLEEGQAYFNVLPDDIRPFTLIAGERAMVADISRFQVTLVDDAADIVVEEGSLIVRPRRRRDQVLAHLSAGQQASADGSALRISAADLEAATAWRSGRLVVRDRPLREVVAAFNLYSSDRLVLGDGRAGDVRISGSFRYDGSRELAMALANGFDLSVVKSPDGSWRIEASEGTAGLP